MPETYKRRYGLDWHKDVEDIQIDLILAKKWKFEPFSFGNLLDPGEHMLRAIRGLFTPDQWTISPWTEEHAHAWAGEDFSIWLGAASSGKSNDAGGLAVLDWITDPFDTYIAMGSTSIPMLKLRSFESVTRYFRLLKKNARFLIPGKEMPSQTAIVNDNVDDDNDATSKASIRGVALADGESTKAIAKLAGAHLPWVTIILDEGEALPEAAAKARFNAAAGTKRFRFLSLANPVSRFGEATRFCVPVDGWDSVTVDTPSWRSQYGLVLHHNGFLSPAILEKGGEEKYPFLMKQSQIDRMLSEVGGNEDDPMIWCMVRGFPPLQGAEAAVLTPADLTTFHAHDKAVWRGDVQYIDVAGLDPAFTSGGDGCMLQRARVGVTTEGLHTVSFFPPDKIPIMASSMRPGAYQAVDGTVKILREQGIPIANLACDDSGTQSVCDIIEVETGARPIRCNFSSKATPPPDGLKDPDGRPVKVRYRNMVTEIWHSVAALVRENQIRDMPLEAASQFCSRRYQRGVTPLALESKIEYKKRTPGQKSPDEGDALALCVLAAMRVAGVVAGKPCERNVRSGAYPQGVFGHGRLGIAPKTDYTAGFGEDAFAAYARSAR